MSRTAVIVSSAEDSRALCRLCMIYHEYFVDIFIPNNTFRICAEKAIHDLLSLKVSVGDGLPSNICHQCVKKLMEFRDFKDMCLKTAAELRKCDLDNFLKVSKIKDEDAADVETSREGSSQEKTFLNDMHVTEVYITAPDEHSFGNVSHAKEELWSSENAFVVKEEVNDGEHRIEGNVPVNALTSVAVDPLAVDTMCPVKDEFLPMQLLGKATSGTWSSCMYGESLVAVAPNDLTLDPLALENQTDTKEVYPRDPLGESDDCGEDLAEIQFNEDAAVCSESKLLLMDDQVDCCNNIGKLTLEPEKEADKFGADRQLILQNEALNDPSCDLLREENLQLEHSMANSFVVHCLPEERVKNQKKNVRFYASSEKQFSPLNDRARPIRNQEREQLCHQAENANYPTDYICNYCSTRYLEKESLAVHIKRHMVGMRSNRVLPKKDIPPRFSENLLGKAFTCNECGKKFSTKRDIGRHVLVHSGEKPFKCNECGKMFTQRGSLKTHSVIHTGVKKFKCNECEKMFTRKSHLNEHSVIHTGMKRFKCNECGKMFTRKSHLNAHSVIHTGMKRFKCNECEKMFTRKSHLNAHSVIHTGMKRFKCNECGKMFTQSSHLKTHSLFHTGVKRFKCNECGKMFTTKGELKMHSVVHTGVKPFKCNECEMMFTQKSSLTIHSVIHTGVKRFKCNECGKMFTTSSNLRKHSVVHTGVKRFKCEECGKMFTTSSNLRKHSVVHTGVKRFKCFECGKMFTTSSSLTRHSAVHTGVR